MSRSWTVAKEVSDHWRQGVRLPVQGQGLLVVAACLQSAMARDEPPPVDPPAAINHVLQLDGALGGGANVIDPNEPDPAKPSLSKIRELAAARGDFTI